MFPPTVFGWVCRRYSSGILLLHFALESTSFKRLVRSGIFAVMNDELTILNNPIWSALISDNTGLGSGTDVVRLFDAEIAPFAGLKADTRENFLTLFNLVEEERVVVLFSPKLDLDISPFEFAVPIPGYQMVFEGELAEAGLIECRYRLVTKNGG